MRAGPGNPAAPGGGFGAADTGAADTAAADAGAADAGAAGAAYHGGQRPLRMLFVGDDPGHALRARALLNDAGLAAEWLENGHDAGSDLDAAADWADCALVDMRQPEGLDVVRALLRRSPRLPVIVLAAAAGRERALTAVREGAHGYLKMERLDADQIARAVRQAIERKRLEYELRRAERLAGIGLLAGRMAHQLNNLLSIILNYADFVAEALPGGLPHETARRTQALEDIGRIREAARRAANLSRQLTILAEQDQPRPEIVRLNDVIEGARVPLAARLGDGIALELLLDPGLPPVQADRAHLEHLLSWLADHARDDLGGTGRVIIGTARVARPGSNGESNGGASGGTGGGTGSGTSGDPADAAFAQLELRGTGCDATRGTGCDTTRGTGCDTTGEPGYDSTGPGDSTGLGLAVVEAIVTRWGGRVEVRSEPGRGSTVTMLLPAVAPDSAVRRAGRLPSSRV